MNFSVGGAAPTHSHSFASYLFPVPVCRSCFDPAVGSWRLPKASSTAGKAYRSSRKLGKPLAEGRWRWRIGVDLGSRVSVGSYLCRVKVAYDCVGVSSEVCQGKRCEFKKFRNVGNGMLCQDRWLIKVVLIAGKFRWLLWKFGKFGREMSRIIISSMSWLSAVNLRFWLCAAVLGSWIISIMIFINKHFWFNDKVYFIKKLRFLKTFCIILLVLMFSGFMFYLCIIS